MNHKTIDMTNEEKIQELNGLVADLHNGLVDVYNITSRMAEAIESMIDRIAADEQNLSIQQTNSTIPGGDPAPIKDKNKDRGKEKGND